MSRPRISGRNSSVSTGTTVPPNETLVTTGPGSTTCPTKTRSAPVFTPRAGGATCAKGVPDWRKSSRALRARSGTSIQGPDGLSDCCVTVGAESNPKRTR